MAAVPDRYLPLSVGAKWTYHTTDPASGASADTSVAIEAFEDVGGTKTGTMAYRVRSTTLTGGTLGWHEDRATSIVLHREQFLDGAGGLQTEYVFMPYRLRLDEGAVHTAQGATWTETNTASVNNLIAHTTQQASFAIRWTVDSSDEVVTVPAGTFHCLRLHRVETGFAALDETRWFARHVGKVKQMGKVDEVLTSYSIP